MVHMPNGAHVYVWFSPFKFLFSHFNLRLFRAHNQIRTDDPVLTKNVLYRLSYVGTCPIITILIT